MIWPFEHTPNVWPLLTTVLFLSAMGFYAFRNHAVPGTISFIILVALVMLWCISNALELAATDDKIRIFWFKVERALLLPAISAELCFALEYTRMGKRMESRPVLALAVPPLIFALMILTNDNYHLVWTSIWLEDNVNIIRGPASWGAIFYALFLSLLSLIAFLWLFFRSPRHRWIAIGLICSLLIMRGAFLFDITNWNPMAPYDPMMVAANFAMIPYALAIFRFRMFDVMPIARHTVIEKMSDGMVVIDAEKHIADINEAAREILNVVRSGAVGRKMNDVLHRFPKLLDLMKSSDDVQNEVMNESDGSRWYHISVSSLIDRQGYHLGHLILLHDITKQKQIQAQMLDDQQTMALLREREMLGRELHDGIGQMLAAAHLQVKAACDLLSRKDTASVESSLHHLADLIQKAKDSVRDYLVGVKTRSCPELGLLSTIRQYLNHYSNAYGIHTELIAPPGMDEIQLESSIKAQLQPIIREALTNVRKHSEAASVRIIFGLSDNEIIVTIEDNGKGFHHEEISDAQGFGFRSMRGRADVLGATMEVQPTPGKGTLIIIRVPYKKEKYENSIGR